MTVTMATACVHLLARTYTVHPYETLDQVVTLKHLILLLTLNVN